MLSVSSEMRRLIESGAKQYIKATLLLADGTTMELTENDFMAGTPTYSGGICSSGTFDIAGCVIKAFKFQLNNFDGKFSDITWKGSRIKPYFGVLLSNGSYEWVQPDIFYTVSHKRVADVIICEAYDGLKFLDEGTVVINDGETAYAVVNRMLTNHGITLQTVNFPGYNISLPAAEEMTERQALAYIMQRIGSTAFMTNGQLKITKLSNMYTVSKSVSFSREYHTQPLGYTGVRYTCDDGTTYSAGTVTGSNAYVYELKEGDNPLIVPSNAYLSCASIWNALSIVQNLYPCKVEIMADPTLEPGDCLRVPGPEKGTYKVIIVTNFTYKNSQQRETISFDAEEREETDLRQVNVRHVINEAAKKVDDHIDAYTSAFRQFEQLVAETMGVFFTEEVQSDGSSILYMHDKQNKADSQTIWKMTANTLSVSTDGGATFNAGVDSSGNLITNVLYAIKVSADVLEGGIITDSNGYNWWNLATGEMRIQTSNSAYTTRLYSGYMHYISGNTSIGRMGTNGTQSQIVIKYGGSTTFQGFGSVGMDMDLDNAGNHIAWFSKKNGYYEAKLFYCKNAWNQYDADTLNLGCDIDMNMYSILDGKKIQAKTIESTETLNASAVNISGVATFTGGRLDMNSKYIRNPKLEFIADPSDLTSDTYRGYTGTYRISDGTVTYTLTFKNGVLVEKVSS